MEKYFQEQAACLFFYELNWGTANYFRCPYHLDTSRQNKLRSKAKWKKGPHTELFGLLPSPLVLHWACCSEFLRGREGWASGGQASLTFLSTHLCLHAIQESTPAALSCWIQVHSGGAWVFQPLQPSGVGLNVKAQAMLEETEGTETRSWDSVLNSLAPTSHGERKWG